MYDATATYAVGDIRVYNGTLYQCNTPISTPEAFTPAHWTAITVEDMMAQIAVMQGATSSANGVKGLVPAPQSGDQDKVLKGDGTWDESPGAKQYTFTLDPMVDESGSYSHTTTGLSLVTADMKPETLEVGTPSAFKASITVTCNAGSITVACPDVEGSSTIKVTVMKQGVDPTVITSTEFDVLDNRIGTLTNLTTQTKANTVAAINEIDGNLKSNLAWVEDGDTAVNSIASGDFVSWKGVLCTASSAITAGDTLSSTNLTEVSHGGLNALNSKMLFPVLPTRTQVNSGNGSGTATITTDGWHQIYISADSPSCECKINNCQIMNPTSGVRAYLFLYLKKGTIISMVASGARYWEVALFA